MTPVGGASSATTLWDSTDWTATKSYVRRLQIRIAKAVREGRWGKDTIHLLIEPRWYSAGHRVEPNGTGNEDPFPIYNGSGVGRNIFVYRAR